MTSPSKTDIEVAIASLRAEADIWDGQSEQIAAIVPRVEALRMTRLEAGIFQLMVSSYDQVVDLVTARCHEGAQRTTEIASTLRHVADTYEDDERRNEHAFRNLY
ncbi:hypothetical protein ACNTMW_03395 [Planosporangium sp. 12N6]|uniref:hypothetical protein n=1 Tax=Planosporangium spinosum TaxID=3402278 RepID=UPI003CECCD56